jgi:hypothetical protein
VEDPTVELSNPKADTTRRDAKRMNLNMIGFWSLLVLKRNEVVEKLLLVVMIKEGQNTSKSSTNQANVEMLK